MPRSLFILILISFVIIFTACVPQDIATPGDNWDYADLRTLSGFGDFSPELDFIAGYTRIAGGDLQIRLDFLDQQLPPNSDIYIALDTKPGGTIALPVDGVADIEWDTLLVLPASRKPQAIIPSSQPQSPDESLPNADYVIRHDLTPRIVRVPWQDYILTSLNLSSIPESKYGFKVQAFSTEKDSLIIEDSIGPFRSDALPPDPAPLVLAFWNTFPVYTPAQSLRRWDGAHTGPYGERHGLSILLKNVRKSGVPVVLLDIRDPLSLSALDYIGAVSQIQELASQNLLVLPDLLPGSPSYPYFPIGLPDWASSRYLEDLSSVSRSFDLNSSDILYSHHLMDESIEKYRLVFTSFEGRDSERYSGREILPLPPEKSSEIQATPEGLNIPIRKLLLGNALNINDNSKNFPLLILGGSLLESAFGDPQSAAATLSYISNHPWINPLNKDELRSLPLNTSPQVLPGTTTLPMDLFLPSAVLKNLPNPGLNAHNPLYQSAWDSALSLYAPLPPEPDTLPILRSIYSGQPGIALEAARWADNPLPRQDCSSDPDMDGVSECVLASDSYFAILDPQGARLLAFYFLSENGIHQIIGPTSQFIVGLADPSEWRIDAGEGADTGGVHGAFADQTTPWILFNITHTEDFIEFTSPDKLITKRFSLSPGGIRVEYDSSIPQFAQIPIATDPWTRFSPGWSDQQQGQSTSKGYLVQINNQIEVDILSDAAVSAYNYRDSQVNLDNPEDPNYDYPQGHYIPYPMTILEINSSGDFFVEINPSSLKAE